MITTLPTRPYWKRVHDCIARLRARRGHLVAFGGGRDPREWVRPAFVWMAGGAAARIAILPVASWQLTTAEYYLEMFRDSGAADVWIVDPEGEQCNDPAVDGAIGAASGVVLTGGDQKRLARELRGTRTLARIENALERGAAVFTTSASTMALSDVMVGGVGDDDRLMLEPGLEMLPGLTIETHVDTRNRHGRLVELVERKVNAITVGLDEDTAMVFLPQSSRVRVLGTGSVVFMADYGPCADAPRWRAGDEFDLADLLP